MEEIFWILLEDKNENNLGKFDVVAGLMENIRTGSGEIFKKDDD